MNLHRFDLVSLRLFAAVADAGSVTAGAEGFGISLAAASKRITELEGHVGNVLLERSKRGVMLTPAGHALQRHAIELVARLQQLSLVMDDFQRGARGHLRLWANTSAFAGFLPAALAAYAAAHPDVRIDLEDVTSEDGARAVAAGIAELAVIGENTPTEGLQTLVCDSDELVLVLPADHPLAGGAAVHFAQALAHDFVAMGRKTSLTRQIGAAAELAGCAYTIRIQVRSFDAMCRMVAAGLGLGILPRRGAELYASALGLTMLPVVGLACRRRLLLALRDRAALSGPARAFVEMIERRSDH